jgi:hypothetical protein
VVEAVEAADAAAVSVPVPLDDVADADAVLRRWARCIQRYTALPFVPLCRFPPCSDSSVHSTAVYQSWSQYVIVMRLDGRCGVWTGNVGWACGARLCPA